jgi:hypothetical protein
MIVNNKIMCTVHGSFQSHDEAPRNIVVRNTGDFQLLLYENYDDPNDDVIQNK